MYLMYLWEVLKRAFAPTVRITDGLQIAAASAVPALGKFVGVKMPESVGNDALSYIGASTLAFLAIRLFWAPYAIWKDQVAEATDLRLELSKPERLVLQELAKHRAKARTKLVGMICSMSLSMFAQDKEERSKRVSKAAFKAATLARAAGYDSRFDNILMTYAHLCKGEDDAEHPHKDWMHHEDSIISFLNNDLTIEDLVSRWQLSTESKKQP